MSWREAAIEALRGGGQMDVASVTERIAELQLRELTGNTPSATVGAMLYRALQDGDPRIRQVGRGLFEHTGVRSEPEPSLGLGRLVFAHPRSVWAGEATGFTPWLLENAEFLSEVLGIELELERREHSVGSFLLDLYGSDFTNDCPLIVENQLEDTDHKHLGQLITYAAGTDAGTVVWIAPRFRDEHRQALEFLNNTSLGNVRFFGLEIKIATIGDSEPAPFFNLVAGPSDWREQLQVNKAAKVVSPTQEAYRSFWKKYLGYVEANLPGLTTVRAPQPMNWMTLNFLRQGITVNGSFTRQGKLTCQLYIDAGDEAINRAVFESLTIQKSVIEADYGAPLDWQPMPDRQACRIQVETVGSIKDESEYERLVDWLANEHSRMKRVFRQRVKDLPDELWAEVDEIGED